MISERGECYMGKSESVSADSIRGHIDTILLRILDNHDSYGYELIKRVSQKSDGRYELKEPSLYTSLRRLEGQQCIESYWGDESQGGRRKYYRITPARYYNGDTSRIRLEKKSKFGSLGNKISAPLTEEEAQALVDGDFTWMMKSTRPLVEELYSKIRAQGLRPKTIVDYTREPYVYPPGNVRGAAG